MRDPHYNPISCLSSKREHWIEGVDTILNWISQKVIKLLENWVQFWKEEGFTSIETRTIYAKKWIYVIYGDVEKSMHKDLC